MCLFVLVVFVLVIVIVVDKILTSLLSLIALLGDTDGKLREGGSSRRGIICPFIPNGRGKEACCLHTSFLLLLLLRGGAPKKKIVWRGACNCKEKS